MNLGGMKNTDIGGIGFNPGTDDIREVPAIPIIDKLAIVIRMVSSSRL